MPIYAIVLICICGAAVLLVAALSALAATVQLKAFGTRFNKNPLLKYFSAEDFCLTTQAVECRSFGHILGGFIYSDRPLAECAALVVFCHGMGPGQCSYTTEIAYFCRHGYAVLALDSQGCGLSSGKALKGLEAGIYSAVAAYNLAKGREELKHFKVFFVGHSMGGYAALCAAALCRASGAVAFAPPESPVPVVCNLASKVIGRSLAALVRPFLRAFARLYVGRYANMRASKALKGSGVPAIIFQGDGDKTVPQALSAYSFCGELASCVLCRGKGHNPYNTQRAERLLGELSAAVASAGGMAEPERTALFSSVDYTAVCEEDEEVMSSALAFIADILAGGN